MKTYFKDSKSVYYTLLRKLRCSLQFGRIFADNLLIVTQLIYTQHVRQHWRVYQYAN